MALPSEDPEDADDGARRSLRLSLLKSAGVRVFSSSELPAAVCASVSTQTEAHEAQARVAAERRCLAESALFDSLTAHALAGESSCTDGDISTQRALRREAAEAAESAFARAYVFDGRKKAEKTSAPQQQQRFVEICGCVCAVCASCSCGLWLDALRVLGASDHELFFLQTAEPLARDAETGGPESLGRNLHCQLSSAAANTRAEKSSVGNKRRSDDDDEANEGLRRLRWGVFGGCAGGTSLRRCLRVIREFPLLISAREEKAPSDTGPAPAASPGERGRSLLLAEALLKQTESLAREFSRPANAVSRGAVRVDLEGSLRLRVAAAHARCFLHPALCAADFEVEGRGLVATDAIGVGELVVQIPVRELVGAYAALVHPVFGRVASVMLGAASAEEQPRKKRQREAGQPLVDSDACCCLYLLFLAFAMGLQGGAALLQFLPAASPSDAAGVASAVGMAPDEQRAAAERASLQIPLLHGPPEAVDFAARVFPSVASTTETTHERAFSVYRQLMDILRPLFPAPPESSPQELERRGVLHACTRAAQAAAFADAQAMRVVRESASQGRGGVAAAAAAVAVSAAAREAAERGRSPWTRTSGERTELESAEAALVGEFLSILDYQDFLWAEQVLASRSFSACPPPLSPLREVAQQTQTAAPAAEREGDCSEEEQDEEEEKEEETEEEEEDAAVPFLPELPERRGCSAGFSSSRGRGSESERRLTAAVALIETPFSSPTFSTSSPDGQGAAAALVRVPRRCACFIPFAELLNHHPLAQVGPPVLETRRSVASEGGEETEKSELVLSLRVITQVAQGAQVYLHYGPLQSWEFATFFGFVPSQPLLAPFDCWSSSESGHESSFAEGKAQLAFFSLGVSVSLSLLGVYVERRKRARECGGVRALAARQSRRRVGLATQGGRRGPRSGFEGNGAASAKVARGAAASCRDSGESADSGVVGEGAGSAVGHRPPFSRRIHRSGLQRLAANQKGRRPSGRKGGSHLCPKFNHRRERSEGSRRRRLAETRPLECLGLEGCHRSRPRGLLPLQTPLASGP